MSERIDQIKGAIELGLTRHQTARIMGITYGALVRWLQDHEIEWPIDDRGIKGKVNLESYFESPTAFLGRPRKPIGSLFDYHPND